MNRTLCKLLPIIASLGFGLLSAGSLAAQTLYVANYTADRVGIYDVSNPSTPGYPTNFTATNVYGLAATGTTLYATNYNSSGSVGSYNATTGAPINTSLITGLNTPTGLALAGSNLFVVDGGNNRIGRYNFTTSSYDASFISGVSGYAIAASESTLYVASYSGNSISSYNLSSGSLINSSMIAGLSSPTSLVVSGSILYYVSAYNSSGTSMIGRYDLNTNSNNLSYISGLNAPSAIAVSGSTLYVTAYNEATISNYDISGSSSGALITSSYISGLNAPLGLAVPYSAVPEPATYALLAGFLALGLTAYRRRRCG